MEFVKIYVRACHLSALGQVALTQPNSPQPVLTPSRNEHGAQGSNEELASSPGNRRQRTAAYVNGPQPPTVPPYITPEQDLFDGAIGT